MGNQHSTSSSGNDMPTTASILTSPESDDKNGGGIKKRNKFSFKGDVKRSQSVRVYSGENQGKKSKSFFNGNKGRRSTLSNVLDLKPYQDNGGEGEEKGKQHVGGKASPVVFTVPDLSVVIEEPPPTSTGNGAEKVSKPRRFSIQLSPWKHHKKSEESNNQEDTPHSEEKSKMTLNFEKLAKELVTLSRSSNGGDKSISRHIFQRHMVPHSAIAEKYLWNFFSGYKGDAGKGVKPAEFVKCAETMNSLIMDKEQISFYVKVYAEGTDILKRTSFIDFLISAYHLSSSSSGSFAAKPPAVPTKEPDYESEDFDGKLWIESVAKSCFHIKEEMSVFFVSNWILTNLPRLIVPMHKYFMYQLTVGYARLPNLPGSSPEKVSPPVVEGDNTPTRESPSTSESSACCSRDDGHAINPVLMWLLLATLPSTYLNLFQKKKEGTKQLHRMNSIDLLKKFINMDDEQEQWSLLYDSVEQGLSVNRLQFHVFNYRGPTLMFITCEGYTFLVGIDVEWRENCHFWGGEHCIIVQLKPEFRIEETGAKCIYANFAIRGYPFGMQMGRDPKKVTLEIKPDFEYVYFKKIPCRLIKIAVWGCAPSPTKIAQVEHKKWEAKESEKQKKINLANIDWNDNPDKYLLELGGNYRSYTENK